MQFIHWGDEDNIKNALRFDTSQNSNTALELQANERRNSKFVSLLPDDTITSIVFRCGVQYFYSTDLVIKNHSTLPVINVYKFTTINHLLESLIDHER